MNYKTPAELTQAACASARAKCAWSLSQLLLMGVLAGAYVAFGGFLYTVVTQDQAQYAGVGVTKFLGGAAFSLGLMLVVIGGGELFTGNCLMPLGTLAGCASPRAVLRNWFWVYVSNWGGALLVAELIHLSGLASGEEINDHEDEDHEQGRILRRHQTSPARGPRLHRRPEETPEHGRARAPEACGDGATARVNADGPATPPHTAPPRTASS